MRKTTLIGIVITLLSLYTLNATEVKYKTKQELLEAFNKPDSCPLRFASETLKANREIVLKMMSKACFIKD